ncbi:MAG TPA: VOC family protein [Steroidobacter sp.]|uniref:VOC family protein n=1 Tax=Steroidobacter sp. TaxID=1978227 RepID=UPI002EDAE0CA
MADQNVRGRFVWHELVTPDANAAHAFYGKAIGWKSQPWEEDASYVMFAAPRGPIGATVGRDSAAPHWLPYIGTGDIENTIELAKQKGGSVVKEVETLSTGSRYAVLQDPYGATFGVYESAEDYGKITPPKVGEHSWHELLSPDHEAAFEFYSALFGWEKIREHDMGPMGTYLIYGLNGDALGGMMKTMDSGQGTAWLSYVHVKDVNQTAQKVKSAGGQIINGPMEVPGGDWIVAALDPQGAMFAAHASAANMKKPEKKPKQAKKQPQQLTLETENPPPAVQEPETPAEQAPPADKPVEEPAQKAPAKKAPARKAPAKEAPAKRAPAKKSPAKKAPAKKGPAKKAPAKKSTKRPAKKSGGKKSGGKKSAGKQKSSKKRPAAKGAGSKKSAARRGAKKGARKVAAKSKTRSGGKKKAVKKPRKGK